MPGFKLKERRLPSRRYPLRSLSPSIHNVNFAQAILYRGAGLDIVWCSFAVVNGIGVLLFAVALFRFRRTLAVS
jgi:ABC-2 type transport system permease protein